MSSQSPKILRVNASGRRAGSSTRRRADALIAELTARFPDADVTERELADGMPFVDDAWINANFTPKEERSADQAATLALSDTLVGELQAADIIVIGAPIYNFSVPAVLKAWIDQIARARLTFQYTEKGPVGLLKNKKAVIVTASGGTAVGGEQDFAIGYLKHVLKFIGIDDVSVIAEDRQMVDAENAKVRADADMAAAVDHLTAADANTATAAA